MPKITKFPRLRRHVRKGAAGQVWVSWHYDMRPDGKPDVALGNDYEQALKRWDELHHRKPRIAGTILEAMEAWEADELPEHKPETRNGYTRQLARIKPVFGPATWDSVTMRHLTGYLKQRTAKTQGNRELAVLSIVWNYARKVGMTSLPWPAAGMERSKWKNKEKPRRFAVTDDLFAAVYEHADQVLRDCMDLATATAMRLTDCRTILLPLDGVLRLTSAKTGKAADFELALSDVLPGLVARRRALKADHLMLLSTPSGRPLSARMLRDRWDEAREKAAADPKNGAIKDAIEAMYLRDMRKRGADLAGSLAEASKLLQHDSEALTAAHYRTQPTKLRPVR